MARRSSRAARARMLAPLSPEDPNRQQVNASHAAVLVVRARTLLALAIEDVIGARAVLRRHAVGVGRDAQYLTAVVAVELEGLRLAGVGGARLR